MGVDFWTGALVVVLVTGLYTVLGGLRAVLFTDFLQVFVIVAGSLTMTVFGLRELGGWEAMRALAGPERMSLWKPAADPAFPWTGILFGLPIVGVRHFGREVFVRGNCDQAPFSLASMMRGAADWMMDLMDEGSRERAERLLDHCAEAGQQFIRLMAATGAHMVSKATARPRRTSSRPGSTARSPSPGRSVSSTRRTGWSCPTPSTSAAGPTASSTGCWRRGPTRSTSTTRPTRGSPTTG